MIVGFFYNFFSWFMLFIIMLNISQRKIPRSDNKRKATLLLAVVFLVVYVLLILRQMTELPEWTEWIIIAAAVILLVIFRKTFWPFRLKCARCGRKLSFNEIIGEDLNICHECYLDDHPEEREKERRASMSKEEVREESFQKADLVSEIDWDNWEPTERCVLTYVTDGDRILLIEKRKGLGEGYINAPGGHIELEETKMEAAIRETKEETGIDVEALEERAVLRFQFKDGLRMIGYVFFTSSYSGTMIGECDETRPFWTDIKTLDYSKMWEDDILWLPLALQGKKVDGYFIFDDLKLIDSLVKEQDSDE